jgi:HD-like signal output (HDOD) protein/CheY-like chemotaxis protein
MDKKNILFVDENENVISGIQRQLRSYREQWQLFFATNANQALELMEQNSIDLIISDMMLPKMRGDELLKIVGDRYPMTVRLILSGLTDEASLKSALQVAHQYLSKPCSAETLRETISQVFKIQFCLDNFRIAKTLGDASQLPSLPSIYHELNAAIGDEKTTVKDLAKIFSRDMVLTAKLLHLINSPYFGMNRVISNLEEAINLIGIKKLNNLVVSVHVKSAFPVTDPKVESYMEYLWKEAGRVSELARLISLAENQDEDRPDQAFLGGLLHNMGLLIFLSQGGEKLKSLLSHVAGTSQPVTELETAIYGFTRSEAAAYVLSLWKIPPRIIEAIMLQNSPNETDYDGMNALTAVHVAACLLKPQKLKGTDRLFDMTLDEHYLKRINKLNRLPVWQESAEKVLIQAERSGR